MAHNGKLKLSDYPNFSALSEFEKGKVRKALDKRQRREKRKKKKDD